MLKVEYPVGILFNTFINQKPFPNPFTYSNPFFYLSPYSNSAFVLPRVCFITLRYVSAHSLNVVVVTLTLGSALPLGTLQ